VHIPKGQRYTIGSRIEHKFLGLLELAYVAYFTTDKDKKIEKVEQCILSLDVLKFLIHVAWEAKLIGHKHFADLVEKLNEVGRMLGGWKKKLENPENKNREC